MHSEKAKTARKTRRLFGADKVVYLTFDAGYENGNVARVPDALAQADATVAFFALDNLVRQNPDLIRRMTAEGHLACNHSYAHRDMTSWCADDVTAELTRLEDACREAAWRRRYSSARRRGASANPSSGRSWHRATGRCSGASGMPTGTMSTSRPRRRRSRRSGR